MPSGLPLSVDAMGGDHAPNIVIEGAAIAYRKQPQRSFLFFGDEKKIGPLLDAHPGLKAASTIVHTDEFVPGNEKPSLALRRGKNTSMRLAIEAVKDGKASGVVSAGNTGAFMAMSKMIFKTLPGITRPAIAGIMPNVHHDVVMLDLGANVYSDAQELCEFALMGDAYARAVLGIEKPKIGLLNIGSEDMKGHEEVRGAANILREASNLLNFIGFVEGDDITNGEVDVVVTDGFSGNIALKSSEGVAMFFYRQLRTAMESSWAGKLAYLIAKPAFKQLRIKVDPRRYNGAMFLGLNGIAVKSHGGADGKAFANAIKVAYELIGANVNEKISQELNRLAPLMVTGVEHLFADIDHSEFANT
ncbi:MAG: phosphate acyltransferase PlsX [Rickettsiales bacterium]